MMNSADELEADDRDESEANDSEANLLKFQLPSTVVSMVRERKYNSNGSLR